MRYFCLCVCCLWSCHRFRIHLGSSGPCGSVQYLCRHCVILHATAVLYIHHWSLLRRDSVHVVPAWLLTSAYDSCFICRMSYSYTYDDITQGGCSEYSECTCVQCTVCSVCVWVCIQSRDACYMYCIRSTPSTGVFIILAVSSVRLLSSLQCRSSISNPNYRSVQQFPFITIISLSYQVQ